MFDRRMRVIQEFEAMDVAVLNAWIWSNARRVSNWIDMRGHTRHQSTDGVTHLVLYIGILLVTPGLRVNAYLGSS